MEQIENKVAGAILEKPVEVQVKEKAYKVDPVSIATLIEVSALISKLPWIDGNADNIIAEALRTAKDCHVLGKIVAVMIIGSKKGNWAYKLYQKRKLNKLSDKVLQLSPSKLNQLVRQLIGTMELSSFFGLTTSLSEINLLKPKKEVEKTTAFGQ